MGPVYKILRHGKADTKRIVKFLGVCKDPRLQRYILQRCSDSVYKSICNAFYNVAQNRDIRLSKRQLRKFSKHTRLIKKLISPEIKLKNKRAALQRGGSFFLATLLPLVIESAISYLGTKFIKNI